MYKASFHVTLRHSKFVNPFPTLALPYFEDIYNREASQVKIGVVNDFIKQILLNPEPVNKKYFDSLTLALFSLTDFFGELIPERIDFKITSFDSLVVKCLNKNGVNLYVETFFDPATGALIETVVNVFKGTEQLFTEAGEFEQMLYVLRENFVYSDLDYVSRLDFPYF